MATNGEWPMNANRIRKTFRELLRRGPLLAALLASALTVTIDSANPSVQTYTDAVTVMSNTVPAPAPSPLLLLAAALTAIAALSALRIRTT